MGRWQPRGLPGGGKPGRGVQHGAQLTDKFTPHRGPLNEDVFSAPSCVEEKGPHPSIQELTEQIHRLLLQVGAPSCPPASVAQGCPEAQGARPSLSGSSRRIQLLPCALVPMVWVPDGRAYLHLHRGGQP